MKKNKIYNILESISKTYIGIIFSIIVLVSPLINEEIALGHDYNFHVTNALLANKSLNLLELKFIPSKIFGETIANGFGYGTGIFYPPLSYYLTSYMHSFFNFFNLNIDLSITCAEILVVLLSSITMYIFLKRVFKDTKVATIGSISYISSTYFLCEIYVRSAIGEVLTFIFIPIVFLGLYELFFGEQKKFIPLFTIGYIGMIHSHLVLSVYLTIIILIIFLCFRKEVFKKEKLKKLILSSIIILLISSPYLIPLLEHKIFGNYVVFEPNSMYTIEKIKQNSLKLETFITERAFGYNGIKIYINHIILIISILTITFNKKIFFKENKIIYKITILIIIITTFMSSSYFPWENMPNFLKMIQFPWRLCGITSFGLAILAGNVTKAIKGSNKLLIITIIAICITLSGFNTISLDKLTLPKALETMDMGVQKEYLPSNSKKNLTYFNSRHQGIVIKDGNAQIKTLENNTPYLKVEVLVESNEIIIELPRLYYLGYKIILTDTKGNKTKIDYYENKYGFIELELSKSGILEIDYEGTIANKIANIICIGTIIVIFLVIKYKKQNIHILHKIKYKYMKRKKNKKTLHI